MDRLGTIWSDTMPELPEVEIVTRGLIPNVEGKTIQSVEVSDVVKRSKLQGKEAIIKGKVTEHFIDEMSGMTVERIERRSKYIYFHLMKDEKHYVLVNHLGMTGAWFYVQELEEIPLEKYRKHAHVIFTLDDHHLLVYSDIRRFGELRLLNELSDYRPLLQLAPEPFDEAAESFFIEKTKEPKYREKPIKAVIMDGQVISGCGNIYATESLFRCGIHPNRSTSLIEEDELRKLFQEIVNILQESIEIGGSSVSDYVDTNGEAGSMQDRLQLYQKSICPVCHTPTEKMTIAGRTSVFCRKCQK